MKRKSRELILIFLLVFSLLFVISNAFIISHTTPPELRITGEVTGGGHINLTNSKKIKVAVGQPVVGVINNTALKICLGIFCGKIVAAQPYNMNFTGQLNYTNGTAVANTWIKAVIKNETVGEFSSTSKTDSFGDFLIIISDLPSSIIGKDLDITFYVWDDIEARYECWYNHSSEKCCSKPLAQPCV